MGEKEFKMRFGVDISELVSGMTAATEVVQESSLKMKESLLQVKEAFSVISEAVLAVTAIMAGGKIFGDMVQETVKLNVESISLGKQFGVSATQASVLKVALDSVFVSQEEFSTAGGKLERQLKKNEGAFNAVGIATRDTVTGGFRPLLDIMLDTNKYLGTITEGTNRGVEAAKLYGRGFETTAGIMRVTKEALAAAAEEAKDLNLVVSQESVDATQKYRTSVVGVHDTIRGLSNTIGQVLLPVLTSLGTWFRSEGPAAIQVTRNSLSFLIDGFAVLRREVFDETATIKLYVLSMAQEIKSDAMIANAALHLNWDAVEAETKNKTFALTAIYSQYVRDLELNKKQADDLMSSGITDAHTTPTPAPTGTNVSGDQVKAKSLKDIEKAIRDLDKGYAELEKEHDNQIRLFQAEAAEFSKNAGARISIIEKEVASETAAYGAGSKQAIEAEKRLTQAKQQAADQTRQMADFFLANQSQNLKQQILNEQKAAEDKYANHLITAAQLEAIELNLEDRLTEIDRKAIEDRKKLIDPLHDPIAYAKVMAELEAVETGHQARIAKIREQAAKNDNKLQQTIYKQLETSFTSTISGMLKGTLTLSQAFRNMAKDMLDSIIDFLAKWAAQWLVTQIANMIASKTAAVSNVGSQAAVAGASGTASFAGAPWPIDLGAPAFGAAMAAAAGSFGAAASAEGGFDIPEGRSGPLVKTHPREMILPEHLSDAVREMAASGARGGGGSTALHVKAMDGLSVKRVLLRHDRDVTQAMRKISRGVKRS